MAYKNRDRQLEIVQLNNSLDYLKMTINIEWFRDRVIGRLCVVSDYSEYGDYYTVYSADSKDGYWGVLVHSSEIAFVDEMEDAKVIQDWLKR
jgi:uncharacterized protein YeeX (DUF496 family)